MLTTILLLESNPYNDLQLSREIRELKIVVESESKHRDSFEVKQGEAVRPRDLQQLMLRHEPQIVHFCGHGQGDGGLILQDENGNAQSVDADALSTLFELCAETLTCVVLNACHTAVQAEAIVKHIDYAIGMRQGIGDDAARYFSRGFYQALGYGKTIEQAYRFGCNAIQLMLGSEQTKGVQRRNILVSQPELQGKPLPEYLKPQLYVRGQGAVTIPATIQEEPSQKELETLSEVLIKDDVQNQLRTQIRQNLVEGQLTDVGRVKLIQVREQLNLSATEAEETVQAEQQAWQSHNEARVLQEKTQSDEHDQVEAWSPGKPYKRLIVLVPGLGGVFSSWEPLRQRLAREPGFGVEDAKWLPFSKHVTIFTRGRIENLAIELHAQVVAAWIQNDGFDDVILVGHSLGGMVVRQAYLLAVGAIPETQGHRWGRHVSRIVLFASLNRGISLHHSPGLRLLAWSARHLWLSRIFAILQLPKGGNFPTNLRINWMRHFARMRHEQQLDPEASAPPLVVQLLGSKDGVVDQEDSKDIKAFPNGHEYIIPGATHRKIFRIDLAPNPEELYALLRKGFTSSFADDPQPEPSSIERVVFLLHGIRASNVDAWIESIEKQIYARDPVQTQVIRPAYGYFSAAQFVLPGVRKRNIAIFQDWYTDALAKYPNATFNIIAHSNGTYILGNSLRTTPSMQFDNVVLAGSVLPQDFWLKFGERLQHQVGRIRNDRANRDWPVALLCNGLRGLMMQDIGTAGFAGFKGTAVEHEVAYHVGDHEAALKPEHQKRLVDFVLGEPFQKPQGLVDSPGYFRQLSNAMPYVAASLPIGLTAIPYLLWKYQIWSFQPWHLGAVLFGFLCLYVILDIL